jgi:hypothetical protein
MKHLETGRTGKAGLVLMAALMMALALVGPAAAEPLAPDQPGLPHFFRGLVTTDHGILLPGKTVVAQAATGGWTGTQSTITDAMSRYGYTPQFYVPGYGGTPESGAQDFDEIKFLVDGVQARLDDVETGISSDTYTFCVVSPSCTTGPSTVLNLVVPLTRKITASAGPNGAVSPGPGDVTVNYGFDQTFTFTPNPDYLVQDVLVDGVSNPAAVTAGSYKFTNVTVDHTILVTFVKATYTITPTAGVGCTIDPSTVQIVPYKGSKVFNFTPNTGYDLINVKVDGASQGPIISYPFTNVQADHTIEAICARKSFVITPIWGANGSITPGTPQTVLYGDSVTFTMVPAPGYAVDNVQVNSVSLGPLPTYTFPSVVADGTIAATFKAATFVITASAGPNGSISPGTVTVNYGANQTFTFTPNPGYRILDVLVDGVSNPAAMAAGSHTFTNVTADHTIHVTFGKWRIFLPIILR